MKKMYREGNIQPQDDDRRAQNRANDRGPAASRPQTYDTYHALTVNIEEFYLATMNCENYRPPRSLRGDDLRRNPNKYCTYYSELYHNTNDCWDSEDEIKALIRDDHIQEYKAERGEGQITNDRAQMLPKKWRITHRGGTSSWATEDYACELLIISQRIQITGSQNIEIEHRKKFGQWFIVKAHELREKGIPEFIDELFALANRFLLIALSYLACVINGVKFVAQSKDDGRKTLNSGVFTVGV